jgi:hypothetical protein
VEEEKSALRYPIFKPVSLPDFQIGNDMVIGPNGSDTWTFSYTIDGTYSDGRLFSKSYPETLMSDDHTEHFD